MAVYGLVPTQSKFEDPRSALHGIAAQRIALSRMPAEDAGDLQVRPETEIRSDEK